jgi:hypothetical protein
MGGWLASAVDHVKFTGAPLHNTANAITTWPTVDLFAQYY